jgi:formyltetrahydrofolate synthetase
VTSPEQLAGRAYALAGVAGAAPGFAAETIAPDDAYLEISGDFRALAAALDWLAIQ